MNQRTKPAATTEAPLPPPPVPPLDAPAWKPDWELASRHFVDWWERRGMVLWLTAPRDQPWETLPEPQPPADLQAVWLDPQWRARRDEYKLSRTWFGGDSFPKVETCVGAGDLGAMLGCQWDFAPSTVWFKPSINDPDQWSLPEVDPDNFALRSLLAMTDAAVRLARGRFFVAMPDLVENFDILSALRDPQTLLMDCIDRPEWVERTVDAINNRYFDVFERFYRKIRDARGGNVFAAFCIWGPGRTAKVQCDACAMFGPDMFARFVKPALARQCERLDYAMYHLDGPQCIVHLDHLLSIPALRAIQWTPGAGRPPVTDAQWHPMYRRILAAGKGLQLHGIPAEQVIPMIESIGTTRGLYISTGCRNEDEGRRLQERVDACRDR